MLQIVATETAADTLPTAGIADLLPEAAPAPRRHVLRAEEHFKLDDGKLGHGGIAAFAQQGFIAIDDLVSPEELVAMRTTLMRLHQENVGFGEGANFDAASPVVNGVNERTFPQILGPRAFAPELIGGAYFKTALNIAKQLIGDQARFKLDISFMKPPQIGSVTAWHQDESFANPEYDHKDITIWLALTPASSKNSCMSYIPGSNAMDILPHQPLGGDPRIHALECIEGFDPADGVEVPLEPGCVSIHGCRTLHYAGANQSDDYRLAYALLFDIPPVLREKPRHFPWREIQHTDRLDRQQKYRRRGGIFVHIWRDRHRIGFSMVMAKLCRVARKWTARES